MSLFSGAFNVREAQDGHARKDDHGQVNEPRWLPGPEARSSGEALRRTIFPNAARDVGCPGQAARAR